MIKINLSLDSHETVQLYFPLPKSLPFIMAFGGNKPFSVERKEIHARNKL